MKILVTGTAGFIGFHLAKKLLERGDEVIGLDNINEYYTVDLKFSRLRETGIDRNRIRYGKKVNSSGYPKYSFIQLDLEDNLIGYVTWQPRQELGTVLKIRWHISTVI